MNTIKGLLVTGVLAVAVPATADVKTVKLNKNFFDTAATFDFGTDGRNTLTFSTVDRTFFAYDPDAVATTG